MTSPIIVYDKDINMLLGNSDTTVEHATLSRLVRDRDWSGIERLLEPMNTRDGYQHCLYLVYRQAYLCLLSTAGRSNDKDLMLVLQKLRALSPSKEEFTSLCSLLTTPSLASRDQDTPSSRQHLLYQLLAFVHKNLHPNVAPPTSTAHTRSRLVDLVVRGMLYEQCETLCRDRYSLPHPRSDQREIINIVTLLQSIPDTALTTPPAIQPLMISTGTNVRDSVTPCVSHVTPCVKEVVPLVTPCVKIKREGRLSSSTPKHHIHRQPSPQTTPISHQTTPICKSRQELPTATMVSLVHDTHPIRCVAFSDDGSKVAIGANSRILRVLNARPLVTHDGTALSTLPVIHSISDYHNSSIYCAAWSSNSSLLATGSNDQSIKVLHHGAIKHGGTVREMCFISSNHLVAGGSGTHPLKLIDTSRLSVVDHYSTSTQVLSLAAVDSNMVVSGDDGGCIKMWDVRSHSLSHSLTLPHPITSVTHSNGCLAYCTTSGDCHTLSLSTNTTLSQWSPHTNECRSIRYSPCGKYLLTSSYDRTVCITDTATMKYTILCCHDDKVIQSRWHPSGRVIATTSADKTTSFWRLTY